MRHIIGLIMMTIPVAAIYLYELIHQIYWFWKCYTEGGDYEHYASNIAWMLGLGFFVAGLLLFALE